MDAKLRQHLVTTLITTLMTLVDDETLKQLADHLLDFAENYVKKTPNTYDDMIVGGLCGKIRQTFDIKE